jgi:phenylpropionate dioxygenase-like ring-hydroxylating dioxygenase large terminal subunit
VFAARFQLAPARPGETFVAATVAVPGRGISARLKLAALRAFFIRIFAEDRAILELIAANREAHRGAPIVFAPQDLLRPGIEAILAGRAPVVASPRTALLV